MPTFATPEPISVTIDLAAGDVWIAASERIDTNVDVRPSDPNNPDDVKAAEETRVEYVDGFLSVRGPKRFSLRRRTPAVDVTIALPTGSQVNGETGAGSFRGEGQFAACTVKTGFGGIALDETGQLRLDTSLGDITVRRAAGRAEITTGSGRVRVRELDGTAVIKNSNGATWVGAVSGDIRLNAANGDITVDRAQAGVDAKTANGSIRLGEVVRGVVVLETSLGELEVGIRRGTAAKLDARSQAGRVHNMLDAAAGPEATDEIVEVRARTSVGDIVIRRSQESLSNHE